MQRQQLMSLASSNGRGELTFWFWQRPSRRSCDPLENDRLRNWRKPYARGNLPRAHSFPWVDELRHTTQWKLSRVRCAVATGPEQWLIIWFLLLWPRIPESEVWTCESAYNMVCCTELHTHSKAPVHRTIASGTAWGDPKSWSQAWHLTAWGNLES